MIVAVLDHLLNFPLDEIETTDFFVVGLVDVAIRDKGEAFLPAQ